MRGAADYGRRSAGLTVTVHLHAEKATRRPCWKASQAALHPAPAISRTITALSVP